MNQVPEQLYLGQNLKQYVMKEAVVLLKLLNYLAFQSFDFELPDEGYSRNVHVH
jgi:hypothetical protein